MLFHYSLLWISLLFGHPLHVTITSIDIDHSQREIAVSHKFFADDFSLLFFHLYEKNIKPEEGLEFTDTELELIRSYMADAFVIKPEQDSIIRLEYVSKKQDENSIWIYFSGVLPPGDKSTYVLTNKIMLDLYNDQTNLVIVAVDAQEWGFTFDYRNTQAIVEVGKQ